MALAITMKMLTSEAMLVKSWPLKVPACNDAKRTGQRVKEGRASDAGEAQQRRRKKKWSADLHRSPFAGSKSALQAVTRSLAASQGTIPTVTMVTRSDDRIEPAEVTGLEGPVLACLVGTLGIPAAAPG